MGKAEAAQLESIKDLLTKILNKTPEAKKPPKRVKRSEEKKADPERKKEQKFQEKVFEPKEVLLNAKIPGSDRVAEFYDATDNATLKTHLRIVKEELQKKPTPDQWNTVLRKELQSIKSIAPLEEVDKEIKREIEHELVAHFYDNAALYKGVDITSDFSNLAESSSVYKARTQKREATLRVLNGEATSTPAKTPNTNEWAEELEPQIRAGKFPPKIEVVRLMSDLQVEIQSHLNDPNVVWLTGGNMPQSDLGVRIVHDIVNNPNPTKEYLFVKGSQLAHAERLDIDVASREELSQMNIRFSEKVGSLYETDTAIKAEEIRKIRHEMFEEIVVKEKRVFETEHEKLEEIMDSLDPEADGDLLNVFEQYYDGLQNPNENQENNLINFVKELEKQHYYRGMRKHPDAVEYVTKKRAEANAMFEKSQALREKHRGWSSLYVSYEDMMMSVQTPEAFIRKMQDQSNLESAQFEDDWAQTGSREYQQLLQYIHSEDYRAHLKEYLMDKANQDDITLISGVRLTDQMYADKSHPWMERVLSDSKYQDYRDKLALQVRIGGMLRQGRALMNSGMGLDKLPQVFSQIGDHLDTFVFNQRNGIASDVFQVMDQKMGQLYIDKATGLPKSVLGGDILSMKQSAIDQLYAQRHLYADKWKGWQGSFKIDRTTGKATAIDIMLAENEDLVRLELRKAVEEVYFYQVLTGREVKLFQKALTPLQEGKNGYAGQPGEGQMLQGMSPFKWVLYRWGVLNPLGRLVTRNMFHTEAARYGIDKLWDEKFKTMSQGSPEFNKLAQWAFFITEPNDKKHVENALSCLKLHRKDSRLRTFFDKKREGEPRKNIPTTLSKLTMDDLREQVLYRAGLDLMDARISGAYHLVDSGWNLTAKLDAIKDLGFFNDHDGNLGPGVFLQERAKLDFADYLNALTHEKMHEAQSHMIARAGSTDHHGHVIHHDGSLVQIAKYDPSTILEALTDKLHTKALDWVSANATRFAPLFGDASFGETHPLTPTRPDIVYQGLSTRRRMIDTILSDKKLGAIDYSKWSGDLNVFSADEQKALAVVLGDKVTLYLDCTKSLSDFSLRDDVLKDISNPIYGTHFMGVNKSDARIRWVDSNTDVTKRYCNRVSATIGGESAGGAHARWAGDANAASKAIGEHLIHIIQATNVKEFENHFGQFVDKILFVGGESTKDATAVALFDGWGEAVLSDGLKDFFGLVGENNIWATSSAQRAMGLGVPSIKRDEFDHLMHFVESKVGKLHDILPHYGHLIDSRAGIALNVGMDKTLTIGKYKLPIRWNIRIPTIRAYNVAGFAMQGAALLAIAAYESARKGAKDSGNENAGGGGGGHH